MPALEAPSPSFTLLCPPSQESAKARKRRAGLGANPPYPPSISSRPADAIIVEIE